MWMIPKIRPTIAPNDAQMVARLSCMSIGLEDTPMKNMAGMNNTPPASPPAIAPSAGNQNSTAAELAMRSRIIIPQYT